MNKIETLPICIDYKNNSYTLRLHVNAWGCLVICYNSITKIDGEFRKILSYCVEPNKKPYIPEIFAEDQSIGLNDYIGNCENLDDCIDNIKKMIVEAVKKNEIVIDNEQYC